MVSSSSPALNEELQCSICLEVFTDPVTTPCGHNFCRTCLSERWTNTQTCFCPFCNETFSKKPDLKINTALRKLVQHFKKKLNLGEPEVLCDICDERKQKAVKSCLTCQSSYCDDHLEPHLRVSRLKKHTLINAVENLEDYICQKHERPLEMFCRDDQTCVCLSCAEGEHKNHNTVPLEEESREKKTQTDEQQMIQKRVKKIQEIKHSVKQRKTPVSNDCFLTSSRTVHISNWMIIGLWVLLVAALIILPEQYTRCQSEQLKMNEQQKEAEKQGKDLIKELQQEITELKRKNTELEKRNTEQMKRNTEQEKRNNEQEKRNNEQEKRNNDQEERNTDLLQMYSSLYSSSNTSDWSEISIDSLKRALTHMEKLLNEKLTEHGLKVAKWFKVDLTLDPDTAHPRLIVSANGKQVRDGDIMQDVPENPKRFDFVIFGVLAKQGFSSGRFYYEVKVKGKTRWELGVVRESVNRKKKNFTHILNPEDGYWNVALWNGNEYAAHDSEFVSLSLSVTPEKVGVFVDYEEGLVLFYDVDSRSHIYSFTGQTFTEKLYPYFDPGLNDEGENSRPLIITPVR